MLLTPGMSSGTAASLTTQGIRSLCDIPTSTKLTTNSTLRVNDLYHCYDWYEVTYEDDVPVYAEYLYRTCDLICSGNDNNDGGGGAPTSPPPCDPNGGGDGGGGGGQTPDAVTKLVVNDIGGDGGMPDPTVCVMPPDLGNLDPCATAKLRVANTDFSSKVSDLKGYTSTTTGEHGWLNSENPDGSYSYKSMASTTDPNSITIPLNGMITDILHNHYTGQETGFDGADINAIADLYKAGYVVDTGTFTTTVVTPAGVYMLTVSDWAKFIAFSGNSQANTIDYLLSVYGDSPTNSVATNETALAKVLTNLNGGTGLSLLKQDANGKFNVLAIVNNQLTTLICN